MIEQWKSEEEWASLRAIYTWDFNWETMNKTDFWFQNYFLINPLIPRYLSMSEQ
jgi:hypothetical protein